MNDPAESGARCDICPIFLAGHKNPVPPTEVDSSKLRLIIVGEAPGRKEVAVGAPFVGPTGRFLERMFEDAGERRFRSFSHLTNAAACRSEYDKENDIAALCCAPRLYNELIALDPKVPIVAAGKAAAKSVLNVRSIMMTRGFVWETKSIDDDAIKALERKAEKTKDTIDALKHESLRLRTQLSGRTVFPILHPAFILRSDTWKPILQLDVRRIMRFLRGEFKTSDLVLGGSYEVVTTLRGAQRALKKLGPVVGLDIETEGINPLKTPIRCVGIGDKNHVVIIAGAPADAERSAAWDPSLFADMLTRFFATREKIVLHNGLNFDLIALERDGIKFDPKKIHDTLFVHHTIGPHFPHRMDQVVSEFTDSLPWKIVFGRRGAEEKGLAPHQMPPEELYRYNNGDVYREVRIWEAMQADLEAERTVYEHDMALGHIAKQMQVDGIHVDVARREEIAKKMKFRAAALKGQMRTLTRKRTFSPTRLNDVRKALFTTFGAPVLYATPGGDPSTSSLTLEALRQNDTRAGRLADLIIKWRVVSKIKSTYLDAIEYDEARSHFAWKVTGTVSGRWSSRFQSIPRWSKAIEDRVREIYDATPGYVLHYFDLSQSEMRAAAWLSGDENFMRTCEGDVHVGNAKILFPKAADMLDRLKGKSCPAHGKNSIPNGRCDCGRSCLKHGDRPIHGAACNCGKPFRDIAKNAGFGILYSAEIETIFKFLQSKGFDVSITQVSAMFNLVRKTYATYYKYCESNLLHCQRHGFLRTALMKRIRWIGWFPKPGDPYNYVVQGFIADLMNLRLLELHPRLPRGARVVAQIHDALIVEAPKGNASSTTRSLISEIWAVPVQIPGTDRKLIMPIDLKEGERWSDFG